MGHRTMGRSVVSFTGLVLALAGAASVALGQDYGFDWVTVGDPGNRDTLPEESPWRPSQRIGGVDYEYRIARNKLTTYDYLEFVRAYAPHYEGQINDRNFLGHWLTATPDGFGGWSFDTARGTEGFAASLTWEMAARYCNWLHNGKADEKAAFENGAYDTSTFYYADGRYQHQAEHNPDARFWLPTIDEYAKAAYWDPDKNGGEGGYWRNPDGGDEQLLAALPEDGGETIGDLYYDDGYFFGAWDMNQYPGVRSPWGLVDISGTLPDWLEAYSNSTTGSRKLGGSLAHDIFYSSTDRIDVWDGGSPNNSPWGGLRLVTTVPSPGGIVPLCAVALCIMRRERR
ncbi:MAG: hypothetical protein IT431_04745 [Phycisphaerales bacterium]|nr:hypothetical protein [Phycisphaerales bacterium]